MHAVTFYNFSHFPLVSFFISWATDFWGYVGTTNGAEDSKQHANLLMNVTPGVPLYCWAAICTPCLKKWPVVLVCLPCTCIYLSHLSWYPYFHPVWESVSHVGVIIFAFMSTTYEWCTANDVSPLQLILVKDKRTSGPQLYMKCNYLFTNKVQWHPPLMDVRMMSCAAKSTWNISTAHFE